MRSSDDADPRFADRRHQTDLDRPFLPRLVLGRDGLLDRHGQGLVHPEPERDPGPQRSALSLFSLSLLRQAKPSSRLMGQSAFRARHALPWAGVAPAGDGGPGSLGCQPRDGWWRGDRQALEPREVSLPVRILLSWLMLLCSSTPLATLSGHSAPVARVAFHPSGDYLASASFDGTWRMWDVATSQPLTTRSFLLHGSFYLFGRRGAAVAGGPLQRGLRDSLARRRRTGRHRVRIHSRPRALLRLNSSVSPAAVWTPSGECGTRGRAGPSGCSTGTSSRSPPWTGLRTGP